MDGRHADVELDLGIILVGVLLLLLPGIILLIAFSFLYRWIESPPLLLMPFVSPSFPETIFFALLDIGALIIFVFLIPEVLSDEDELMKIMAFFMLLSFLFSPFAILMRLFLLLLLYLGWGFVVMRALTAANILQKEQTRQDQRGTSRVTTRPKTSALHEGGVHRRVTTRPKVSQLIQVQHPILKDVLTNEPITGDIYYVCPRRGDHVYSEDSVSYIKTRYEGRAVCPLCKGFPELVRRRRTRRPRLEEGA